MATIPQTPTTAPPQSIPGSEPSRMFLDFPDADIILRSCDSLEFRVLKLYIIKSSPVLNQQMQAISSSGPSCPTISTGHGASEMSPALPVLRMSDNGAILAALLTFIFPLPAVLPPTLEEIMELLSTAQKYEMSSVLGHIRGQLALNDPPFIRPENAFHAYTLALKYGLLQEAAQAARATLRFTLTIEEQEENLDVMPGAHLHDLWKFHQGVQSNLFSTINDFRRSVAYGTLKGLQCAWISGAPRFFDPIEFQLAFARHINSCGTPIHSCRCANIPSNTIRTFWADLTDFFHRTVAKSRKHALRDIRALPSPINHCLNPCSQARRI
ncbi:hypothetical protein BC827DRAFT_72497 [Russula dissimulans]|nr:hypothetical protein BC827DRAFT_72497 [Russula dissimulans]